MINSERIECIKRNIENEELLKRIKVIKVLDLLTAKSECVEEGKIVKKTYRVMSHNEYSFRTTSN